MEDWQQATKFLIEEGYFCETITAQGKGEGQTRGLVFAYPDRLQTLANRGLLTIFDSTHKFNVHDYNLFTFMCRNEAVIWVPGANCLVEKENSNILATALRKIYEWSGFQWKMEYPLTDNSAIEKAAVRKAFGGEGHIKQHLLCTVHSERTLRRRFRSQETQAAYEHMRHAIRVLTETDCIMLCNLAITATATESDKRYIQQEWLETRQSWAMFARQHNQLLLQATSSNACEAWHARLKLGSGLRKGDSATHGIYGYVRTVHGCAHDVDNKILATQMDERTRHTILTKTYPSLKQFPFAVQKTIALEEKKVAIRLEQDMPLPVQEYSNGLFICHCLFSRRYQLPCQHLFHMYQAEPRARDGLGHEILESGILTPEMWAIYKERLNGGGFEMYERQPGEIIPVYTTIVRPSDNKTLQVLRLREMNERIRSTFYQLEEQDPDRSSHFVDAMNNLITTIISLPLTAHPLSSQPTVIFSSASQTTPAPFHLPTAQSLSLPAPGQFPIVQSQPSLPITVHSTIGYWIPTCISSPPILPG